MSLILVKFHNHIFYINFSSKYIFHFFLNLRKKLSPVLAKHFNPFAANDDPHYWPECHVFKNAILEPIRDHFEYWDQHIRNPDK